MFSEFYISVFSYIMLHWFGYILSCLNLLFIYSCLNQTSDHIFNYKFIQHDRVLYTCFIITMCSMVGIPPFFGFWTKLYLFFIIGSYGTLWIILCANIFGIVCLLFYLYVLRVATFSIDGATGVHIPVINNKQLNIIICITFFLCIGGLFSNTLLVLFSLGL